jgi:ComEC/Rec2-related protein
VRLIPPSGPVRPHSYDFAFQSYFSSIGAIGFFLGGVQVAETTEAKAILRRATAAIENLRLAMTERIQTTIGGPEGAIAAALITGIRAGIPEDINEALRVAGLYHVISISGLHMALVGGTLMLGLRIAFAFSPTFSMRHPVKKYAAFIALVATAFYLMISGGDVAAQRSFIMLAVMLIAILFDRAALTMRNLAVSAIIILLISPHEVAGPSFQMSFAATAALVASYAAWSKWRENAYVPRTRHRSVSRGLLRRVGATLSGLAMTSVIAGFATALFSAWHFQQVAPMGLFANLAAMPIVSIIVMPMAVVASVLMPLGLDTLPLLLMGEGIAAMNFIAIWLAERSLFNATGAIPLQAVLILTGALACLTLLQSRLRWLALPPAVVGLVMLISIDAVPDILISDDARLVAMRMDDGRLAINRTRPRAFTLQNWQRAMRANEVVGPSLASQAAGFLCAENLCVATHGSGARIGHAANADTANGACGSVMLLIVDDATTSNLCRGRDTIVITKRDLARRGSAEIFLTGSELDEDDIRFAIAEPYRPWHEHRRFSREARGLAPYRRSANTNRPGNDPAENAQ